MEVFECYCFDRTLHLLRMIALQAMQENAWQSSKNLLYFSASIEGDTES